MSKQCSRCKADKPTSEFYPEKGRKDGLNPICKKCRSEMAHLRYLKVPPEAQSRPTHDITRYRELAAYCRIDPPLTLQQIGDRLGITREAVRLQLKRYGLHKPRGRSSKPKVDPRTICPRCGDQKTVTSKRCRACYGRDQRTWQPVIDSRGYARLPMYQRRDGMIFEHQLVASQAMGRPLQKGEEVHHINGNRADNRPENLLVCTRAEHVKIHLGFGSTDEWSREHKACAICGTTETKHESNGICKRCYQREYYRKHYSKAARANRGGYE